MELVEEDDLGLEHFESEVAKGHPDEDVSL